MFISIVEGRRGSVALSVVKQAAGLITVLVGLTLRSTFTSSLFDVDTTSGLAIVFPVFLAIDARASIYSWEEL